MTTHLITGVTGQDGVLLARALLARGDRVVGTVRPQSPQRAAMTVYLDGVEVVEHELTDAAGFAALLASVAPDRIYNLAAHTSVGSSWADPERTRAFNQDAVLAQLDAVLVHRARTGTDTRYFQASSAEEHGHATDSPYALAKAAATAAVMDAREQHGLFACAGVLHPHESPLRRRGFVVRKITRAAAEIALGRAESVTLGNLEVTRDWSAAADLVAAMALMLDADQPTDLVLASGVLHTLHDVLELAFTAAGLGDATQYLTHDATLVRPSDTSVLAAPPAELARTEQALGWRASTPLATVIDQMVMADLTRLESGVEESPSYLPNRH
ncbi:GDP-mannose 4,6-dehydratase [Nocardioides sp. Bht2]|uniref:GDP-mannose 4,6-dehydratase n=1 Tax=Nocardioides sp. Bht2 TaxID=3392297 RepID=UPI0039B3C5A7